MVSELIDSAQQLFQQEQYSEAATAYQNIIKSSQENRNDPRILQKLGLCYYELADLTKAAQLLQKSGEILK